MMGYSRHPGCSRASNEDLGKSVFGRIDAIAMKSGGNGLQTFEVYSCTWIFLVLLKQGLMGRKSKGH